MLVRTTKVLAVFILHCCDPALYQNHTETESDRQRKNSQSTWKFLCFCDDCLNVENLYSSFIHSLSPNKNETFIAPFLINVFSLVLENIYEYIYAPGSLLVTSVVRRGKKKRCHNINEKIQITHRKKKPCPHWVTSCPAAELYPPTYTHTRTHVNTHMCTCL